MKKLMKYPSLAFLGHVGTDSAVFVGVMLLAAAVGKIREFLELYHWLTPLMSSAFHAAEWLLVAGDLVTFGILVVLGSKRFLAEYRKHLGEESDEEVQSS